MAFGRPWCFVDVGWGGVGRASINVHVNLQRKYMLSFGCRQVHVFMGGVGWDNNVHGSLFHRSCYATLCFLELSLMRHVTLLYVLLNFAHMRHATLLHGLLNFALMGHATLLCVLLNFTLMRHATVLYVLLNFAPMGHATHPP